MFVERRNGAITGAWTIRQFKGQEELRDDDAELAAFTTAQNRSIRIAAVKRLAVLALEEAELNAMLEDPAAPQEVKDYKREIEKE